MRNKATFLLIFIIIVISGLNQVVAATNFKISGRGWGHGIGMSQYGAKGYADHKYRASQILATYFKRTTLGSTNSRNLRVHVASSNPVTITSSADFSFIDLSKNKSYKVFGRNNYTIYKSGSNYKVVNSSTKKTKGYYKGPLYFKPGRYLLKLASRNDNGAYKTYYRGYLKIVMRGSSIAVINRLNSELYLQGVVPYEMPSSWHIEALKAQACAARSYAHASVRNYGEFDLYSTTMSQVYGGYNAETGRTNQACTETRNRVVKYGSRIVQTFFFSSSGGMTENNENVWGGSAMPYYRGIKSPYEGASSWSIGKSANSLKSILGNYSSGNKSGVRGNLLNLTITKRGYSPRVLNIKISGSGGTSYVSGSKFRSKLGLRSTWFNISK